MMKLVVKVGNKGNKPKTAIQWVSDKSVILNINIFNGYDKETKRGRIETSIFKHEEGTVFQFERVGFFVLKHHKHPYFNMIYPLRANHKGTKGISRKGEQEKQRLEKERLSKIKPVDLFRNENYSEWNSEGIPTKDSDGTPLTKSARKKLIKTMNKHKKLFKE